jgi:hypothetical protein
MPMIAFPIVYDVDTARDITAPLVRVLNNCVIVEHNNQDAMVNTMTTMRGITSMADELLYGIEWSIFLEPKRWEALMHLHTMNHKLKLKLQDSVTFGEFALITVQVQIGGAGTPTTTMWINPVMIPEIWSLFCTGFCADYYPINPMGSAVAMEAMIRFNIDELTGAVRTVSRYS